MMNGMERAKDNRTYFKKNPVKRKQRIEERFSLKIINFIIRYKNSKAFEWIGNHQGLAMSFLVLWGILILIVFLWFIFSRFLP
jgi:hypothetical protein